ncbi:DUF4097 family beta strand repeat-containing protein [Domibacillus robiginosus]|uniref:DUF4097 family beta strand repeat-containing protein n=1 Tax=Domibacillus robiginosus TaxID=1071054 RepID=UPI00067BCDDF|nr:DUF4097 family beta strand repeat-containing protein [Domibacillus robiginosus]
MVKKISIVALALLLIGGVGSAITFSKANTGLLVSEKKQFSAANIKDVQLETENAVVEIIPIKDANAKIELTGKRNPDYTLDLDADVRGDTLTVKLDQQQRKWFNFSFVFSSLTLKVYLPEKTYQSMRVTNDNGRVMLGQLPVKKLNVQTNNGQIDLQDIVSDEVTVQADNGKISVDHVEGALKGRLSNGSIKVLTRDLDRPIQLKNNNGSIVIETETEPTNARFEVHKDNGHINILDQYNGNARFGKGENLIQLTTNNGKIEVTK